MTSFNHLFTPKKIGSIWIKNRIMSTGHMTTYVENGLPTDQLVAYHEERAKGGAGLIVIEANSIHPSASYTSNTIEAYTDAIVPHYRKLADAVHKYDAKMFVQLFHPGREIFPSGTSIAVAPSAVPTDRFKVMPKPLELDEIKDIIKGYADTASRVQKGGLDGVEIVASHGYLISQFWSPRMNLRTDEYGGSLENRLRFLKEVIERIRDEVGHKFVVGLRLSIDDFEKNGIVFSEGIEILKYIDNHIGGLDYFNVTGGSMSTHMSSIFIVPPAPVSPAHFASHAAKVRESVSIPVLVSGRVNDPVIAEKILENGQADLVGMTRAMICDPHMPNKAMREQFEKIRACIACNQACIGHMHKNIPISCIQNPVTGREIQYSKMNKAERVKDIVVVGGGPAGMKAAVIAAERGHKVKLFEGSDELGGQVKLARKIPTREEFGELVPNLKRELSRYAVDVQLNTTVTSEMIQDMQVDEVIIATGATPYFPEIKGIDSSIVVTSWEIIEGSKKPGKNVVIADWKGDMVGVGAAMYVSDHDSNVEIITSCYQVGELIQEYVRDTILSQLYLKEVELKAHYKLAEIKDSTVLFENIYTGQILKRENVDTLVLAYGHTQNNQLYNELKSTIPHVHLIGDALLPRTAEEAILEGFELATSI